MTENAEGMTSEDMDRLGLKLFGADEDWYPTSSDEIEMMYEELVKELKASLRDRDKKIARLEAQLARWKQGMRKKK